MVVFLVTGLLCNLQHEIVEGTPIAVPVTYNEVTSRPSVSGRHVGAACPAGPTISGDDADGPFLELFPYSLSSPYFERIEATPAVVRAERRAPVVVLVIISRSLGVGAPGGIIPVDYEPISVKTILTAPG